MIKNNEFLEFPTNNEDISGISKKEIQRIASEGRVINIL